jgi:protocatechuate 3,4-dioxygenase alpha subunit
MAGQTPWQTTGPFLHFGLPWKGGADLTGDSDLGARPDLIQPGHDYGIAAKRNGRDGVAGQRIEIFGQVWDNKGAPIVDCLIEIWQANAAGRYAHPEDTREDGALDPAFIGFGRTASDKQGAYRFRTIKPGRVSGPGNTLQAPHIAFGLMGPGFLKRLATRIYFPADRENAEDPILGLVPEERRSTLIARCVPDTPNLYRFDIRLGGNDETVFFDI